MRLLIFPRPHQIDFSSLNNKHLEIVLGYVLVAVCHSLWVTYKNHDLVGVMLVTLYF